MILPGFKTGPRNWAVGHEIVEQEAATMGEVWFNVLEIEQYKPKLAWFTEHSVRLGLHYWGMVDSSLVPNLATHHDALRQETIAQVKQTIDYGQSIACAYVNVHPGACHIEHIDFTNDTQRLAEQFEPTSYDQAAELFTVSATELEAYAAKRSVLLTFETVPAREKFDWNVREPTYNAHNITPETLSDVSAKHGIWIANDISHTASQAAIINSERSAMMASLMQTSEQLAPRTRLLHINTMSEPFNGTDSHDGITSEDFANNVFPNHEQLKDWLRLFKDHDAEVFAVLEPSSNMRGNYQALVQLLAEL